MYESSKEEIIILTRGLSSWSQKQRHHFPRSRTDVKFLPGWRHDKSLRSSDNL